MGGFDTTDETGKEVFGGEFSPCWQVKFAGDDIISKLFGHLDYRSNREETLEMFSGEKLVLWTLSFDGCDQFARTVGQFPMLQHGHEISDLAK